MLSRENPPLDLSCFCKIPLLKENDEGASDSNSDNPLQSFSMRDYVFGCRSKDIGNNWPFSQKSLQLCLKYGVKDVLPPFGQPIDSAKNPTTAKCAADNSSVGEKSSPDIDKITNSSLSQKDIEIPRATLSQSSLDVNPFPKKTRKCRPIVKSNNDAPQKSSQDLASETLMASKVCPVCKSFSSSSNTTLNAHIDQCLSMEPAIKWAVSPKHRIKSRKTRLMVDIYETAARCTLEDLNRRNGTACASIPSFLATQTSGSHNVDRNGLCFLDNVKYADGDADVYVDSNGTKVRILSNLGDLPQSSNAGYHYRPSKKTDKGNKPGTSKRKKYLVQRQKLFGCHLHGWGTYSTGANRLEKYFRYGQKGSNPRPEIRTEPEEENSQHEETEGCKDLRKPRIACDQTKCDGVGVAKDCASESRVLSDKNEPHKRKMLLCNNSYDRPKISLSKVRDKNNHGSSPTEKNIRIEGWPVVNADGSFLSSRMFQNHSFSTQGSGFSFSGKSFGLAIPSQSRKFSSLMKKLSSVKHTPVSKKQMCQKHLDVSIRGAQCKSGWEDAAVLSQIPIFRQDNLVETDEGRKASYKPLIDKPKVFTNQKKKEGCGNADEASPEYISHSVGNNNTQPLELIYNVEINDKVSRETSYEMADQDAFAAFTESMGLAFPGPSHECVSMFCADKVGIDSVTAEDTEINTSETQRNYYVEVDPIPIPGPPGSFLPSPSHITSEEHNVNSSLTTCRIQATEVEHDVIDKGSSVVSNFSGPPQQKLHEDKLNDTDSSVGDNSAEGMLSASGELGGSEAHTLSNSNPILRLMGKNLTVVNKEEKLSFTVDNCLTAGKAYNGTHTYGPILPTGSPTLENMQIDMSAQGLDKIPSTFTPLMFSACPGEKFGRNSSSSVKYHEYGSGFSLISKKMGTNLRVDPYNNVQKTQTPIPPTLDISGSNQKEIIVIDGLPEIGDRGFKAMKETDYGKTNPLYGYPLCAGSPFIQENIKQVSYSAGMNENCGKWIICMAKTSNMMHSGSATFPCTVHHSRSSFYFPHGFS